MTDSLYAGGGIGLGPRPEPPAPEPYPAPVISSRDGVEGPAKSAVTGLVRLAWAHGWVTLKQYAEGYLQHATTGRPSAKPRASILVRLQRGREYATARYVDRGSAWAWDTLWIAGEHPRKFDQIGAWTDAVFGPVHVIAPFPPMHGTYPWRPPYIYPGS